ncbi:MAG TPA: TIGR03013 family XrtA/PEP-CTERM system glycosyltransferase [Polyangiaceae bacterium]|nr:TIGR03013 family XrtA/PEP-CTERM system glycosyltransferase [Polyangiaceae bacterium]
MKLLGHYVYPAIALLALTEFAVAFSSFIGSAHVVTFAGSLEAPSGGVLVLWAAGFGLAVLVGMTSVGLYQAKQRLKIEGVVARIVVALGIAAVCVAIANLFLAGGMPGTAWGISIGSCVVLLSATRAIFWRWIDHEAFQRRVLVFGAGTRAASLLKLRRRSDRRGFNIVAFIPTVGDEGVLEDGRVQRLEGSLEAYARVHGVDEIVVAMDDRRQGFPVQELLTCRFSGIAVMDLVSFLERETGTVKVDLVHPAWLIFGEGLEANGRVNFATRLFDLVVAFSLSVVSVPVMAVVAAAIILTDGKPVLYRQQRVGLRGELFTLYKFRSMVRHAEADGRARWASAEDARVTRVGAVIRKLRLDELPQLFNVLKGDMSMVGPRPERPEFVEQLSQTIPYYHERHSVKPGITGWAQLCYPYGASDQDALAKLQYDLYYIKHKSLVFDLIVLLQTAEVVLWGKGAR